MGYGGGDTTSSSTCSGRKENGCSWTFFFRSCPIPIDGNLPRCVGLSGSLPPDGGLKAEVGLRALKADFGGLKAEPPGGLPIVLGGLPLVSEEPPQSDDTLFLGCGLTMSTGGLGIVAFLRYEESGWKAETWRGGDRVPLVSLYQGEAGDSSICSALEREPKECMPMGDGAGGAGMLCSGLVLTWGRVAKRLRCFGVLEKRGWISRYSMEEEATVPGGARGEFRWPPVMALKSPGRRRRVVR